MKDTFHVTKVIGSLAPAVQVATLKGNAVSLQGFRSALLVVNTGSIVGAGDYTLTMQESDTTTDSDFTNVAAADLLGAIPTTLEDTKVYLQGYIGKKSFIRAAITKNGGTSIAAGAVFVLSDPALAPVS